MKLTSVKIRKFLVLLFVLFSVSCDDASDLIDLGLNPPERKPIDVSKVGVNSFFVEPGFGSISQQYADINGTLKLKFVRVLFAWTDAVQRTPGTTVGYGLFDQILENIPAGVDVVVVLAHTPAWMSNSANWTDGNPRKTFVERWVRPTVERYKDTPRISGWEVWNEPDLTVVPSDAALGLETPANYFELLQLASAAIRSIDPERLVVIAATESINQNFPVHLNYNKELQNLGAENLVDVWNIHYYGKQFETVITSNGVADFLNGVRKPIWVTESGEQGPNNQLAYVETAWPFLNEEIPGISRFYYFQYSSSAPLASNYGLRTNDPNFPVSDLYVHLRDR